MLQDGPVTLVTKTTSSFTMKCLSASCASNPPLDSPPTSDSESERKLAGEHWTTLLPSVKRTVARNFRRKKWEISACFLRGSLKWEMSDLTPPNKPKKKHEQWIKFTPIINLLFCCSKGLPLPSFVCYRQVSLWLHRG